jgi:hypothetical protein
MGSSSSVARVPDMHYALWTDETVAHLFMVLITKNSGHGSKSGVYNITKEAFRKKYKEMQGYIEWKKTHPQDGGVPLYNFTTENMEHFLDLITYDMGNKDMLFELWEQLMVKNDTEIDGTQFTRPTTSLYPKD